MIWNKFTRSIPLHATSDSVPIVRLPGGALFDLKPFLIALNRSLCILSVGGIKEERGRNLFDISA